MARKNIDYTVTIPGRDLNKVFRITEMPASQAERWGLRAINLMSKVLGNVPPGLAGGGMQGLAILGISTFARANWADMEPLMNEMFTCIKSVQPNVVRDLIEDDIEEVSTRIALRQEVLDLHLGFFKAAVSSILTVAQQALQPREAAGSSPNTPTSQPPLQP
jgi:hypothetical protein